MNMYAIRLDRVPEHHIEDCLILLSRLHKTVLPWTVADLKYLRNIIHIEFDFTSYEYKIYDRVRLKKTHKEIDYAGLKAMIKVHKKVQRIFK